MATRSSLRGTLSRLPTPGDHRPKAPGAMLNCFHTFTRSTSRSGFGKSVMNASGELIFVVEDWDAGASHSIMPRSGAIRESIADNSTHHAASSHRSLV